MIHISEQHESEGAGAGMSHGRIMHVEKDAKCDISVLRTREILCRSRGCVTHCMDFLHATVFIIRKWQHGKHSDNSFSLLATAFKVQMVQTSPATSCFSCHWRVSMKCSLGSLYVAKDCLWGKMTHSVETLNKCKCLCSYRKITGVIHLHCSGSLSEVAFLIN